jgi:hypothetical protein
MTLSIHSPSIGPPPSRSFPSQEERSRGLEVVDDRTHMIEALHTHAVDARWASVPPVLWNEPAATDGDFDRGCGLEILEPVGGVSEARHDDDLVGHRVSADDLQQRLVLPAGPPPAMRQAQEAAIQQPAGVPVVEVRG